MRCQIDGVMPYKGEEQLLSVKALNEFDSKTTGKSGMLLQGLAFQMLMSKLRFCWHGQLANPDTLSALPALLCSHLPHLPACQLMSGMF